jgi:hypothetical protein
LAQDSAVATGSGHNGVFNVPGTDIWYIVYHRRPLGDTDGNHRQVCYDRMYFNDDGTIQPVKMLVQDDFSDGQMLGWTTYDGTWKVQNENALVGSSTGKAVLNTNFGDLVFDAQVTVTIAASSGNTDAGVVFRATNLGNGPDAYSGYYAGISPRGYALLGKSDNGWQQLATANITINTGETYSLRVTAVGSDIKLLVNGEEKISVSDSSFASGANGVRVFEATAGFGSIKVAKA